MGGWRREWLLALPADEYEILVDWVNRQLAASADVGAPQWPDTTDSELGTWP